MGLLLLVRSGTRDWGDSEFADSAAAVSAGDACKSTAAGADGTFDAVVEYLVRVRSPVVSAMAVDGLITCVIEQLGMMTIVS